MTDPTAKHYGFVSIILHWLLAIVLIGLYFSGDYMVGLDYYDSWYHRAPELHKAIGVLAGLLMVLRFVWNKTHTDLLDFLHFNLTNMLAFVTHQLFYLLVVLLVLTGYIFTTAKGQGIDVFGLFSIPALLTENVETAELSGKLHDLLASAFMLLFMAHTVAALYHHFIRKDITLTLMMGLEHKNQTKGNSK